jgi:hypothetical protein
MPPVTIFDDVSWGTHRVLVPQRQAAAVMQDVPQATAAFLFAAVLCSCVLCCCTVLMCCAVLCCAVLCCAVLCCAVLCCALLCCCCMQALASLAVGSEAARQQMVDSRIVPTLVPALTDADAGALTCGTLHTYLKSHHITHKQCC